MAFALKMSATLTFAVFAVGVGLLVGGLALLGVSISMKIMPWEGEDAFVPFAAGLLLLGVSGVFLWPVLSVLLSFH